MKIYLLKVLKSKYCLISFALVSILAYFLVPKKIFYGYYSIIAVIFIIVFSLTLTCMIRSIKDKAEVRKRQRTGSIIGFIFSIIGLSALHICTIGAPVCGASIGAAIISVFFPALALDFLNDYALTVVVISILIQIFALYQMKCFKKVIN
ncbi:hypothetical protein CVU82_01230 [Candidatus Falkowbacteria bacterium HGW-Falkowbacteria-1]|uniref:Uncharacterized protein n=1 Tax=Candidatus Falkowbacteria bacterium HGW-Falkowbacteria-1 TaxID=2013768 RepID=A0A2N2EAX1_9BACT|nr:MAG: hypothetical protein CVU82_01230 [Candidatus Falkowbacteria bacterium HGW-Falkowbacteria-1]